MTTAHAHKSGVIFHFFPRAFKQKKIKALRPKMTKIASRGGSCLKGKLHSKIISSDMKDFFSVESNGEGPRSKFEREDGETDGQKWPNNLGWRRRAAGMSHWCQASAVRGCVPILINPEFDAALDRDSCVTHWMRSPGSALCNCGTLTKWHLAIFFFFLSFRECCLIRQWQSTVHSVFFPKLCLILKNRFLAWLSSSSQERLLMKYFMPQFIFLGVYF